MKPDLYICHTAYQVLVETCRAFEAPCPPALVLSAVLPEAEALAARLRATGLFCEVRVFDEEGCGSAFQKGFWRTLLLQRVMGRRNVEKYHGFSLDGARYRDVYIHNDWSVLGRYLQDKGLRYILCEDTFASTCAEGGHRLIRQQVKVNQPFRHFGRIDKINRFAFVFKRIPVAHVIVRINFRYHIGPIRLRRMLERPLMRKLRLQVAMRLTCGESIARHGKIRQVHQSSDSILRQILMKEANIR